MIYEYRRYRATAGNLPVVLERFREAILDIFADHDFTMVGLWTPLVGRNDELHYILEWRDSAHKDSSWAKFIADPRWAAALEKYDANGPILQFVDNQLWYAPDLTGSGA
jgi:hypothetical protein